MSIKRAEVEIRAGRVMCSHQDDYVKVEIEDPVSGIQFVEIEMSFEDFGKMLTGTLVKAKAELRGLEYVGKAREYERATITISEIEYDKLTKGVKYDDQKESLAGWLQANHSREGWMMDTYLGSQKSIQRDYEKKEYKLRIGYFRYVDKQQQIDV